MKLREKIDRLMRNAKINTYKDLLIRMYKQLGDDSAYEKAEREKGNFAKMLNSEFDYIIELSTINRIRYLVDAFSLRYECLRISFFSSNSANCFCYGENINKIADVLFEAEDGATFTKLFHAYDTLSNYYDD